MVMCIDGTSSSKDLLCFYLSILLGFYVPNAGSPIDRSYRIAFDRCGLALTCVIGPDWLCGIYLG